MLRGFKRAVVSVASALGINPVDRKWISALTALNGTYERTGWELSFYVATLVFIVALIMLLAAFGIREYRHSGWTFGAQFVSVYCLGMSCLLVYLVSRAGLRYVFGASKVSAYNTWGRLLWSEDLAGLKGVTFFSFRGSTTMTIYWPDRKRGFVLFNSLKSAVDASVGPPSQSPAAQGDKTIEDDAGPSWTCPHCHEENPGNFEECWKCQRNRPAQWRRENAS
jgi:hypothetical protein